MTTGGSTMQAAMTFRRIGTCAALVALLVAAQACGGGGGGAGGGAIAPEGLQCNSSNPVADEVGLVCGGEASPTTEIVRVTLGGPTSSNAIEGFSFDVVFDPNKVRYVAGSAVQGALLTQGGVTPLLAVSLAPGDPGRLVVGLHRGAQHAGVAGTSALNTAVSFTFEALGTNPMSPTPLRFENAEAVSASGSRIDAISFGGPLTLSRP
jgi:hypothetical protein